MICGLDVGRLVLDIVDRVIDLISDRSFGVVNGIGLVLVVFDELDHEQCGRDNGNSDDYEYPSSTHFYSFTLTFC